MATIDITSLSFEERLRLMDELWESLSGTPEAIPLTEAQREELDRRLDGLDREGPVGIPWDAVVLACMHGRRDPIRWKART
jgi:putative addiction module component (TIGR02574 family)